MKKKKKCNCTLTACLIFVFLLALCLHGPAFASGLPNANNIFFSFDCAGDSVSLSFMIATITSDISRILLVNPTSFSFFVRDQPIIYTHSSPLPPELPTLASPIHF